MPTDNEADTFSFALTSITFSDGSTVALEPSSLFIITGPNSSGKSVALSEIHRLYMDDRSIVQPYRVIKQATFSRVGTAKAFADWLRERYPSSFTNDIEYFNLGGQGEVGPTATDFSIDRTAGKCHVALIHRLDTETRLRLASETSSVNFAAGQVTSYIHYLQRDPRLASTISDLVYSAFRRNLIINFGGGQQVWFHVGEEPPRNSLNDRVSQEYLTELRKQPRLDQEGDGIRSFVGTLLASKVAARPLMLIDEPEAFLHPPQARKLGSILAESASTGNRQLIVATHSSDIIQGAMDASQRVVVCRMTRTGDVNRVSVLDKSALEELWSRPLLRSSVAINGLFHAGAVICEGDADCRFYETLISRLERSTKTAFDLHFVHGGGKGALASFARAYKALSIPTAVIADLDLLKNQDEFKAIISALGVDPSELGQLSYRVAAALANRKPLLPIQQFADKVCDVLEVAKSKKRLDSQDRKQLHSLMEEASDWSEAKRYGLTRLSGTELTTGKDLLDKCKQLGLFIVPEGELERWWREGPPDKAEWICQAIGQINNQPQLFSEASKFMAEVRRFLVD